MTTGPWNAYARARYERLWLITAKLRAVLACRIAESKRDREDRARLKLSEP